MPRKAHRDIGNMHTVRTNARGQTRRSRLRWRIFAVSKASAISRETLAITLANGYWKFSKIGECG